MVAGESSYQPPNARKVPVTSTIVPKLSDAGSHSRGKLSRRPKLLQKRCVLSLLLPARHRLDLITSNTRTTRSRLKRQPVGGASPVRRNREN